MNTITLLSDLGEQSILVMLARGRLAGLPSVHAIIDLTHGIEPGDLRQAAYVMGEVISSFPESTVHIAGIGNSPEVIASTIHGQIIVSPNHELISMIPGFTGDVRFVQCESDEWHPLPGKLSEAAMEIVQLGGNLEKWGETLTGYETKDMPLAVITDSNLKGTVIHIDGAGNVFTNISASDIERLTQGKPYRVILSRHEWADNVSHRMIEGRDGMINCSFSAGNHLVVSVNNGSAQKLLGLKKGAVISVEKI